jgi:F0F1-type ATP synthase delta subunit
MKKFQIKKLAESIVKYDYLSNESFYWISNNFSKKDMKIFIYFLSKFINDYNVFVNFAGELDNINKKKIENMFKNKKIIFNRDDEHIISGICFKYNDFILDCSIPHIIKNILENIKKRLL